MITKQDIAPAVKTGVALMLVGWLILIFGCSGFSTHLFRTEQVLTGTAYTAYTGYTNALANGTLKISETDSNSVRSARLKFAASVLTVETWRQAYETNSAVKPQAQAALDALVVDSNYLIDLINLMRSK